MTVLSGEPVNSSFPSAAKADAQTPYLGIFNLYYEYVCPLRVRVLLILLISHTLTNLSWEPLAN